jgi:hypothetical protein
LIDPEGLKFFLAGNMPNFRKPSPLADACSSSSLKLFPEVLWC